MDAQRDKEEPNDVRKKPDAGVVVGLALEDFVPRD